MFLLDTASGATEAQECDGAGVALAELGNLAGLHLLKVVVRGQRLLDVAIEVRDDAGA